ncbi:VOC family protein [Ochrovirga pacifica]|uniref:VOC family protein n=1 Tax=Ochrovirga pacifica TaxID=1042376 RepID=UPI0002559235|nr:glyoxalase [Ochrovirga pacifica]
MKFKKLTLYTQTLEANLAFYQQNLGLEITQQNKNCFSVQVGWTELEFHQSDLAHHYHYCFLIPSSLLFKAMQWMENRVPVLRIEEGRKTQFFDAWNAESFYFYDGSGNLAECIVHYDLKSSLSYFDARKILGVCEIGLPTTSIKDIHQQLSTEIQSKFWKGDLVRFGTHGTIEAKFLIPNYTLKKTWFPTSMPVNPKNFIAIIYHQEKEYQLHFYNEKIKTQRIS